MQTMNGTISAKELKQMLDRGDDVLVLNVLPEPSYLKAHIPESESFPAELPGFVRRVESAAGSKDARIVVHCSSERCSTSAHAKRALERAGFTQVQHFPGGMQEWMDQGYEVERGEPATRATAR